MLGGIMEEKMLFHLVWYILFWTL